MRVHSQFKDYYDNVAPIGQIFHRKQKLSALTIPKDLFEVLDKDTYVSGRNTTNSFCFRFFVIGFCGKLYPMCHSSTVFRGYKMGNKYLEKFEGFIYSEDEFDKISKRLIKDDIFLYDKFAIEKMKVKFIEFKEILSKSNFLSVFHENFIPYFILYTPRKYDDYILDFLKYGDSNIKEGNIVNNKSKKSENQICCMIHNLRLDSINFKKLVPVYQAYQEIDMFLGGLTIPQKETLPISNEVKIVAHGFDKRHSFRKDKKV